MNDGRNGSRESANRRRFHGALGNGDTPCAHPQCDGAGEFRAPASPVSSDGPPRWRYLCLDHVREFNAGYNYFDGMDQEQIYEEQHPANGLRQRTVWDGPSSQTPRWNDFADPLDAITARYAAQRTPPPAPECSPSGIRLSHEESAALVALGLDAKTDRGAIRRAYTAKLRRFHPDRNGGDRSHEAALGKAVEAYKLLKASAAFG